MWWIIDISFFNGVDYVERLFKNFYRILLSLFVYDTPFEMFEVTQLPFVLKDSCVNSDLCDFVKYQGPSRREKYIKDASSTDKERLFNSLFGESREQALLLKSKLTFKEIHELMSICDEKEKNYFKDTNYFLM